MEISAKTAPDVFYWGSDILAPLVIKGSVADLTPFIEKSSDVLKLEIICGRSDAERYVRVIGKHAQTGKSGDGAIFVSTVERAVKIKTGEEGIA